MHAMNWILTVWKDKKRKKKRNKSPGKCLALRKGRGINLCLFEEEILEAAVAEAIVAAKKKDDDQKGTGITSAAAAVAASTAKTIVSADTA